MLSICLRTFHVFRLSTACNFPSLQQNEVTAIDNLLFFRTKYFLYSTLNYCIWCGLLLGMKENKALSSSCKELLYVRN